MSENDNKKPNCYECIHRRGLMGNAHSRCAHPDAGGNKDPLIEALAIMGAPVGDVGAMQKLGVVGNVHGIRNGWFNWPFNFDPVWLETCDGFTEKPEKKP